MSIKKCVNGSFVNDFYKEYGTDTDTITSLPKTIIGDGQNISAYTIKGNMQQSGTPTPSNPIYPTEVGDKTANLFDVSAYSSVLLNNCTIAVTNDVLTQTNSGTYARSAWKIDGLQVGTDYIMAIKITNPNQTECQIRIYDSTNSSEISSSSASKATSITLSVTFTAATSTHYIRIYSNTSSTANSYTVNFTNIMLNSGSIALPYEPYGQYKIPISLSQNTYNIYITEPLRKSLDGSNLYDTIESNGTLTRRVDANGDALATPTTEQVTVPTLTTTGTAEQFNVLTTLAPSEVSLTYHGWHEHSDTKFTTP